MENNIQESPPGSVSVGNQKSLTCTTDSANPHAEITWTRAGQPVSDHVVTTYPDGQYKAKKTTSTITIATTRDHNGAEYACTLKYRNNEISSLKQTAKLDVMSEHIYYMIDIIFHTLSRLCFHCCEHF